MLAEDIEKKPEDTLRDVKPYLDEAGVTRLADITGMDRIGIPVYASIRPDSKSLAVDSGKGVTKEQAKCSAAMEAIERWAQDEYLTKWQEPHGVVAWRFPMVNGAVLSKDFDHHKWYQAFYYTSQEGVYVPYYHVYNYEKKLPLQEMCWQSGTNGLAIGNNRTEAILHGLYEIIERDAVTIWMSRGMRGQSTNRVDNEKVIDQVSRHLLSMCSDVGVEVCIYNATSDIGIPTFICIMVDTKADIGVYKGYGCNLSCDLALQRAICEAAQARAVFLSGARDDRRWDKHAEDAENKRRLQELSTEEKQPMPHRDWSGDNMTSEEKISYLEDKLTEKGCGKIIVADIMNREHAHVVKVMSEGLEGYWNIYLQLGNRALA
jgi:ribosomal protein S12 methylthiotransferase accessory factor